VEAATEERRLVARANAELAHNQRDLEQILKADGVRMWWWKGIWLYTFHRKTPFGICFNHSGQYNRHQPHQASGKRSAL
jgi:hypothetical protein